jgi:hypothetical protein
MTVTGGAARTNPSVTLAVLIAAGACFALQRTLRQRSVALTNLVVFGSTFAAFGSWVLIPLFLQNPRGLSADLARAADYGRPSRRRSRGATAA